MLPNKQTNLDLEFTYKEGYHVVYQVNKSTVGKCYYVDQARVVQSPIQLTQV